MPQLVLGRKMNLEEGIILGLQCKNLREVSLAGAGEKDGDSFRVQYSFVIHRVDGP